MRPSTVLRMPTLARWIWNVDTRDGGVYVRQGFPPATICARGTSPGEHVLGGRLSGLVRSQIVVA